MRVFISYRRDDTAGRAGRLFDLLVVRLGQGNVFQDVAVMTPGADFTQQVEAAIASSDAVLVVIGPEWLTLGTSGGVRKLDEPGDYVRGEIGAALSAGVPVVPVLVGNAEMPQGSDLPDDLRPLVHRHAVRLRDDSFHQDVDELVRRLDHERATARSGRSWVVGTAVVLVVLVVLAVLGALAWLWFGDGDGNGDGDDDAEPTAAETTPPCVRPGASWESIELGDDPTAEGTDHIGRSFHLTVEDARFRDQGAGERIAVDLRVENTSPDGEDAGFYITLTDIQGLYVDDVSMGPPVCFSASPLQLDPGTAAEVLVAFDGSFEPGSTMVLDTSIADLDVTVTEG
jgi:hypothetical protein